MKITKTFENATLRTVNNGYIELDYNNKIHCFHNASVVSVNNGNISIEVDWKPKKGELIKAIGCGIDCYVIFNYISNSKISTSPNILYTYGSVKIDSALYKYFNLDNTTWAFNHNLQLLPVTPEEQQAFDDFCKSKGKIWNKEKLQWEEYKWMPKENEIYYVIYGNGEVDHLHYKRSEFQDRYINFGNYFQTKEQAQKAAEEVKKLLKSL